MAPVVTKTIPVLGTLRRFPALALFAALLLIAPGAAGAQDYVFNAPGWIMSSAGIITNTGTLSGTWNISSGPISFSGGIQANGEATVTNLGTIDLSVINTSGSLQILSGLASKTPSFTTMINKGTISVVANASVFSHGIYAANNPAYVVNSGTITTSSDSSSFGIRVESSTAEESTAINSGTVTSISYTGRATGIDSRGQVHTYNSGRVKGIAYGNELALGIAADNNLAFDDTIYNTGTVEATAYGTGTAAAVHLNNIGLSETTFYNTGTLSATALGGGTAYAVLASSSSNVHLQTGTRILGGEVSSSSLTDDLFLDGQGDVDFDVTGTWGTLNKTDTGTWTVSKTIAANFVTLNVTGGTLDMLGGMANTITDLNLASGATLSLPTSVSLTATGTATLNGTLYIDASAANLGATTTVLTAGTLNTGAGYNAVALNPDFAVNVATTTGAGGTVQTTTNFAPADDNAALGATATLASVRAFADVAGTRGLNLLAQAESKDEAILVAANGTTAGLLDDRSEEKPWSVYLQPVVTAISRDRDGRAAGFDAMLLGFEGGVDRMVGDDLALGAMAGFGTVDVSFTDNAFGTSDDEDQKLYTLGLYGGYRLGDWKFTDALAATYTEHDSDRAAGLNQIAEGDYDSWMVTNQFMALYDWHPVEDWTFSPRAGLNLSWLYRGEFEEEGAVNAVAYDAMSEVITEIVLGVRATYDALDVHGVALTPYVGAGLAHTLTGADFTVRQRLATASADVKTENDADRLTAEAGMTLSRDDLSFTLGYNGAYAERADGHSFSGTLRWAF